MFVAELEEAEDDRTPRCPEAICKHALVRGYASYAIYQMLCLKAAF